MISTFGLFGIVTYILLTATGGTKWHIDFEHSAGVCLHCVHTVTFSIGEKLKPVLQIRIWFNDLIL